jgi:hypothetical protein
MPGGSTRLVFQVANVYPLVQAVPREAIARRDEPLWSPGRHGREGTRALPYEPNAARWP